MKVKEFRQHLLYADIINFFVTRKSQKNRKIYENINIERENIHLFWTTWRVLMKFSGKMWLNIKSHKKQGFTLSVENTNLEKVTTTVKIWNKTTLSEISEVSILGIGQNRKLRNLGNFLFNIYVYAYECFIWIWRNIALYYS